MKKQSIIIGGIFIVAALITVIPNVLIGYGAIFNTDLLHNLIHFLSGVAIITIALQYESLLAKTLRGFGVFYLALALLGAITTGFDSYRKLFGIIAISGMDHLLHLGLGVVLIVIGTEDIRMPKDDIEEDHDAFADSLPGAM